jgi:predicted transcriptional regulator
MEGKITVIPVRLKESLKTRVDVAARRLDCTPTAVVRLAVSVQLDRLETAALHPPAKPAAAIR